jgi:hypothetical protein
MKETTSAVDALSAAIQALLPAEQDVLEERLLTLRVARESRSASRAGEAVSSMQVVSRRLGRVPTIGEYKVIRASLAGDGIEVLAVHQLIRFFGSWRAAKEAVSLAEVSTARRIETQFRNRRLGKIWRYTDEALGEALSRCASELGRAPQVAEFSWWRQRELELARARGDDWLHLPSPVPYRNRWGSWEKALEHFGYDREAATRRFDPSD